MNVRLVKRVVKLVLGWAFVLLGIVGIFLPILQGILFLVIGLSLLSSESKTARKILSYLKNRYPREYEKMQAFSNQYLHGEGFLITLTVASSLILAGGGFALGVLTYNSLLFALGIYFLSQVGVHLFLIKRFYTLLDSSTILFSSQRIHKECFLLFLGALLLLTASATVLIYKTIQELNTPTPFLFFLWNFLGLAIMGGVQLFLLLTLQRETARAVTLQNVLPVAQGQLSLSLLFPSLLSLLSLGASFVGMVLSYYTRNYLFEVFAAFFITGMMAAALWKMTRDYLVSFVYMEVPQAIYVHLESILREFPEIEKIYAVQIFPMTFQQRFILIQLHLKSCLSATEAASCLQQIEQTIKKKFSTCSAVLIRQLE